MPLKRFFQEQIELLKYLMREPTHRARCVRILPDLTPLFMKVLAGLEKDEDSPHLMLCCEVPFESEQQYYKALLAGLDEELELWQEPLRAVGFELPSRTPQQERLPPDRKFVAAASALADSLAEDVGCIVLILAPDSVADAEGFGRV